MEGGFMWIRGSDSKIIDADNGPTKKTLESILPLPLLAHMAISTTAAEHCLLMQPPYNSIAGKSIRHHNARAVESGTWWNTT